MALDLNKLSPVMYANGFTFWHYQTDDAGARVRAAGYFDAARSILRPDDWLLCRAADEARLFAVDAVGDGVSLSTDGLLIPAVERGAEQAS